MKFDAVAHKSDPLGNKKRATNTVVIFLSNDDSFNCLTGLGQLRLKVAHVPLNLTHDCVACATPFELDDKETLFVLADGKNVHGAGIGLVLLTNHLSIGFVDVVLPTKDSAAPVMYEKVLELFLHLECKLILYIGWNILAPGWSSVIQMRQLVEMGQFGQLGSVLWRDSNDCDWSSGCRCKFRAHLVPAKGAFPVNWSSVWLDFSGVILVARCHNAVLVLNVGAASWRENEVAFLHYLTSCVEVAGCSASRNLRLVWVSNEEDRADCFAEGFSALAKMRSNVVVTDVIDA